LVANGFRGFQQFENVADHKKKNAKKNDLLASAVLFLGPLIGLSLTYPSLLRQLTFQARN
jgi:hypothetical protein